MRVLFVSGRTIDGQGNREVVSVENTAIIVERFDFGSLLKKGGDPFRDLSRPKRHELKVPSGWEEFDAVVAYIPDTFAGPERHEDVPAIWGHVVQLMERAREHALTLVCPKYELNRVSASLNEVSEGRWIRVRYCERGGDVTMEAMIRLFLEKGYDEMEQYFCGLRQSWPGRGENLGG